MSIILLLFFTTLRGFIALIYDNLTVRPLFSTNPSGKYQPGALNVTWITETTPTRGNNTPVQGTQDRFADFVVWDTETTIYFIVGELKSTNEKVWVRDYRGSEPWCPGEVMEQTGPVSYRVPVGEQTWNRHAEQLRHNTTATNESETSDTTEEDIPTTRSRPQRDVKPPERLTYYLPGEQLQN